MMYLSLLSMYNKEKAMILDTFVSVYCLRSVVFKLTLKRVCSLFLGGSRLAREAGSVVQAGLQSGGREARDPHHRHGAAAASPHDRVRLHQHLASPLPHHPRDPLLRLDRTSLLLSLFLTRRAWT